MVSVVLDTNSVIAYLKGDRDVARRIELTPELLKSDLRAKGRMIPENDLWIAACAIAEGLPVLSREEHLDAIVGLERVGW